MARHDAREEKAAGLSQVSQQTGFQRLVGQYSQEAGIVIPGGWRSSPRLLAQYSPVGRPPRAEKDTPRKARTACPGTKPAIKLK